MSDAIDPTNKTNTERKKTTFMVQEREREGGRDAGGSQQKLLNFMGP
jgi:hypothetical protein